MEWASDIERIGDIIDVYGMVWYGMAQKKGWVCGLYI